MRRVAGTASYSDAELEVLLAGGESHMVERKRNANDQSKLRRTVCALANDLPGTNKPGVLFIGIEDKGGCAHLEVDDKLLQKLAQVRDGTIQPVPTIDVSKRRIRGCELAVVTVWPSTAPPVRYNGRAFVRVGPTVQQATAEEERRLSERREASDRPFDMRPVQSAEIEDLDLDWARLQYLPRAVAPDVLEHNRRPLHQQLRSLRLVVNNHPVWAALLGLGQDAQAWLPGAYIQFLRIDGVTITDPIRDRKELTGRLSDILGFLDVLLRANISTRTSVAAGDLESARPDYPVSALQQLARNAVMHRSYESTNAPIRICWYADRVEIYSPGGLYGGVTEQNFGQGTTDYRNPLVAEVMAHLGYAQRFGLGVPLAREALSLNGNPPPEFDLQPFHVAVTVRAAE